MILDGCFYMILDGKETYSQVMENFQTVVNNFSSFHYSRKTWKSFKWQTLFLCTFYKDCSHFDRSEWIGIKNEDTEQWIRFAGIQPEGCEMQSGIQAGGDRKGEVLKS